MHIIARITPLLLFLLCACAPKSTIEGTLLAPDGTPVTKGTISFRRHNYKSGQRNRPRGQCNATPEFRMPNLAPDVYSLRMRSSDGWLYLDSLELRPDEDLNLGKLRLNPYGSIQGSVPKELLGQQLKVEATLFPRDDLDRFRQSETSPVAEDGTFSIIDLIPGQFSLTLQLGPDVDPNSDSKLGIEATALVKSGKEARVELSPPSDCVRVTGQVRHQGKPLANNPLRFVNPSRGVWEDSTLRCILTDSQGRFLTWMKSGESAWVVTPISGGKTVQIYDETLDEFWLDAVLAKDWRVPAGEEDVLWEVPQSKWTVNLVSTTGEPVKLKGRSRPDVIVWKAVDCFEDATAGRWFEGSSVALVCCSPGLEYEIFLDGTDTTGTRWTSVPEQTFTYPAQGEAPAINLVLQLEQME